MPEPITLIATFAGFLLKKKAIVATGKILTTKTVVASHAGPALAANAIPLGHFAAAHAAVLASITGSVVLGAVLAEIADMLATSVVKGKITEQEGKVLLGKAKPLSEKGKMQYKQDLEELLNKKYY